MMQRPSQNKLKKRRFKELDNPWDLNLEVGTNSVFFTPHKEDTSDDCMSISSHKGNKRRCIKLEYKKINRICAEMDVARSRKGSAGIKEQAKIMGSFAILMYDLHTDSLRKMKDRDQAVIREQMTSQNKSKAGLDEQTSQQRTTCTSFEQVGSIRFLKTNVDFYERALLVWIKFSMLNQERLQQTPQSQQFALLQEFSQFLHGFLKKEEQKWMKVPNKFQLSRASELISSIIVTQHFAAAKQFESDLNLGKIEPNEREDA